MQTGTPRWSIINTKITQRVNSTFFGLSKTRMVWPKVKHTHIIKWNIAALWNKFHTSQDTPITWLGFKKFTQTHKKQLFRDKLPVLPFGLFSRQFSLYISTAIWRKRLAGINQQCFKLWNPKRKNSNKQKWIFTRSEQQMDKWDEVWIMLNSIGCALRWQLIRGDVVKCGL